MDITRRSFKLSLCDKYANTLQLVSGELVSCVVFRNSISKGILNIKFEVCLKLKLCALEIWCADTAVVCSAI